MLPSFGNEWKRKINLGGVSSAATPQAIFDRVQAERLARAEHKQRTESAIRIQAWYRGVLGARRSKQAMREAFEGDILGLKGIRCLVLIGGDEDVLSRWAGAVLEHGPDQLLGPAVGPHRTSWLVLIRQASLLLLKSVAINPESPNALPYLRVLHTLLSKPTVTNTLGADGSRTCSIITEYLLRHQLYELLGHAIRRIPVGSKKATSLLLLVELVTLPLSTFERQSPSYNQCLASIFVHIFTIPLLPNRLPLEALPKFISSLPLSTLDTLNPQVPFILESTTIVDKIHLAANTYMFISPHYKLLPPAAFTTYLTLSISLFNTFPVAIFAPKPSKTAAGPKHSKKRQHKLATRHREDYDSDSSDGRTTRVAVVTDFTVVPPPTPPPTIDVKTMKRLEKIVGQAHISTLITAAQSKRDLFPHLIAYLFALTAAWGSASQEGILNIVLATTGGGLVRELYRDLVRRSPLGKEENSGNLMDPDNGPYWPPIIFLSDLYSQALLTMGDDEFFGTAPGGRAVRNPLTLDELVSFSSS